MKYLFKTADWYLEKSSWKDFALVKLCLCAIGILIGMMVPEEKKEPVRIGAAFVFTLTYIPLMTKYLQIVLEKRTEKNG